ncbi:decaprenyl-diphosphate synthase subunit 1 [Trichonephila inaurata madagascariensis]|uniref:All trans-polyprenyl-diphosphate synthase PDSS1 n=2 Tax=Trichonephila TaxID=2585208 RepID=A0A8X6I6S8_9ARAC|nr:decaprenyl-diphosphate synthase subunit 1 [Trichonephila inaurata madagascariensis]
MALTSLSRFSQINTRIFENKKLLRSVSPATRWLHSSPEFSMNANILFIHRWRLYRHMGRSARQSITRLKQFSTCSSLLQTPAAPGTMQQEVDPFKLAEPDLINLYSDIKKELSSQSNSLGHISSYYFDGHGKAFRPVMVVLMARALNYHIFESSRLLETQHRMAIIAEMIHTASLVHDDVIDTSDTRRGKSSVNVLWGQRKAILAGDFILAQAARILAQLGNEDVVHLLAQVLLDLVQGEFMQMSSSEDETERFNQYLKKTFKKTASLTAYTCKAAAVLCGAKETLQDMAFQYGRDVGIAFQLIDDYLDFMASQSELGKPTAADLRLGLATAPVLYASQRFPELKPMIARRFCKLGDVEKAYEAVHKSDGLAHTKRLARTHCDSALSSIAILTDSVEKRALMSVIEKVLERSK